MNFFLRNKSGETLIEVLVAVSVLMYVIAPAASLLRNGIRSIAFNKGQLIAENLAKEGIEAVSIIIDSNLLRLSADQKNCWDAEDTVLRTVTDITDCRMKKIPSGNYRVILNLSNGRWSFESIAEKLNFECQDNQISPCISSEEEKYRLQLDRSTNLYTHSEDGIPQPYYREISIEKEDVNGDGIIDMLSAISRVEWQERGEFKKVVMSKSFFAP